MQDNNEKARIALYVWYAREIAERRAKAEARREARDKRKAMAIYEAWAAARNEIQAKKEQTND